MLSSKILANHFTVFFRLFLAHSLTSAYFVLAVIIEIFSLPTCKLNRVILPVLQWSLTQLSVWQGRNASFGHIGLAREHPVPEFLQSELLRFFFCTEENFCLLVFRCAISVVRMLYFPSATVTERLAVSMQATRSYIDSTSSPVTDSGL
jgi:hypothetical protein